MYILTVELTVFENMTCTCKVEAELTTSEMCSYKRYLSPERIVFLVGIILELRLYWVFWPQKNRTQELLDEPAIKLEFFRGGNSSVGRVSNWKAKARYWCVFEALVQQGIFLLESRFSADSFTVCVQPPCAIACISIWEYVKNPKHWQPCCRLDTQKYCTHG